MRAFEIIVAILAASFVLIIICRYIYKRVKHLPTGDCAYCAKKKTGSKLLKDYNKKYRNISRKDKRRKDE